MVAIITNRIYPDEPCYGLFEGAEHGRWIQKVFVNRNDSIARWQKDYGPEELYERVVPILIPSFGENTVAQLQELAEKNRHDTYWANRRDEMLAESTLIKDHMDLLEQETANLLNKTVLGPRVRVQRNANNRQSIQRYLKERINGN